MRGRSCSGSSSRQVDKLDNLKEKPHLSGAYIRSLVKQLTSSRTKDPPTIISPKDPDNTTTTTHTTTTTTTTTLDRDGFHGHQNLTKFGQVSSEGQHQSQPPAPRQHKKQVRRRLHTSRPYQERLLNMAEARREIVTALKFHRAAMKQSNEQRHQPPPPRPQEPQPQHQQLQPPAQQLSVQQGKIKSRRNLPKIYPSTKSNFSNYLESISHSSQTICCSSQNPYSWPASQIAPPPPSPANPENLNINLTLPSQTLGLNLNFQDFNNLDATMYYKNCNNPSSICSSSLSPSSSSTSPSTTLPVNTTDQEFPRSSASLSILQQQGTSAAMGDVADPANRGGGGDLGLHLAMDDQEMAEIRSIGEQHEMEWNDTLNLVTSAWWFKFFKTTKIRPKGKGKDDNDNDNYDDDDDDDDDDDGYYPFDEVMEFPAWLNNSNDSHHYLNDHCLLDDYFQAPALPCMDIGEIEEIDAEWLT